MTALKHFSAVPERAAADQTLAARDLRVLLAICRAVSRETGIAKISQARIAQRANIARQKISDITAKLERKGYLRRVEADRRRDGRLPVAQYAIVYAQADETEGVSDTPGDDAADTLEDDMVSDTLVGDMAPPPPGAGGINVPPQPSRSEIPSKEPEGSVSEETEGVRAWRKYREEALETFDRRFGDQVKVKTPISRNSVNEG